MKKTETEWPRLFKEEADNHLFDDLHFDSGLKERVRQSIQAEQKPIERGQWDWIKRFAAGNNKWFAGTAAAALIAGFIFVVSPYMQKNAGPFPSSNKGNVPLGSESVQPSLLMGGNGNNGQPNRNWTLPDIKTAKAWFGDHLKAPTYTPYPEALAAIHAIGPREGEASLITISYTAEQKSYQITQVKADSFLKLQHGEAVDIHGVEGYLRTEEGSQTTDLQWFDQGVHYTVLGLISKEEAIKIARSLD